MTEVINLIGNLNTITQIKVQDVAEILTFLS